MFDDDLRISAHDVNVAANGQLTARIIYPPALDVFQGHFPGFPVVPGIYHIEMVRHLHEHIQSRNCRIVDVYEATFHKTVLPGDVLEVTVTRSSIDERTVRAKARYVKEGHTVAVITITLANA